MRKDTYIKCQQIADKYTGYVETAELLNEGFTNRQIMEFAANGMLEKVCHGVYWFSCADYCKPRDFKALEIFRSDSRAVVCADSACFYQGLIDVEPPIVSVATSRSDRSKFAMNFPVARHYFSENNFMEHQKMVDTAFGRYAVYDIERSVCDCIRFRKEIDDDIFCLVIESYRQQEQPIRRIQAYAEKLRMMNQVKRYL